MSLYDKLDEACVYSVTEPNSFYELYNEMDKCTRSTEIIEMLGAEITGKNRNSYIERLFTRYQKLSRAEAEKDLNLWRQRNG
jgi:hypothetical protein